MESGAVPVVQEAISPSVQVPVVVVPGADHFFHTRLHILRDIIVRAWRE